MASTSIINRDTTMHRWQTTRQIVLPSIQFDLCDPLCGRVACAHRITVGQSVSNYKPTTDDECAADSSAHLSKNRASEQTNRQARLSRGDQQSLRHPRLAVRAHFVSLHSIPQPLSIVCAGIQTSERASNHLESIGKCKDKSSRTCVIRMDERTQIK